MNLLYFQTKLPYENEGFSISYSSKRHQSPEAYHSSFASSSPFASSLCKNQWSFSDNSKFSNAAYVHNENAIKHFAFVQNKSQNIGMKLQRASIEETQFYSRTSSSSEGLNKTLGTFNQQHETNSINLNLHPKKNDHEPLQLLDSRFSDIPNLTWRNLSVTQILPSHIKYTSETIQVKVNQLYDSRELLTKWRNEDMKHKFKAVKDLSYIKSASDKYKRTENPDEKYKSSCSKFLDLNVKDVKSFEDEDTNEEDELLCFDEKKRRLVEHQIEDAKKHFKRYGIWLSKDWGICAEEKQLWDKAEMLSREKDEESKEKLVYEEQERSIVTLEELRNRLLFEGSEMEEDERGELLQMIEKKEKKERKREEESETVKEMVVRSNVFGIKEDEKVVDDNLDSEDLSERKQKGETEISNKEQKKESKEEPQLDNLLEHYTGFSNQYSSVCTQIHSFDSFPGGYDSKRIRSSDSYDSICSLSDSAASEKPEISSRLSSTLTSNRDSSHALPFYRTASHGYKVAAQTSFENEESNAYPFEQPQVRHQFHNDRHFTKERFVQSDCSRYFPSSKTHTASSSQTPASFLLSHPFNSINKCDAPPHSPNSAPDGRELSLSRCDLHDASNKEEQKYENEEVIVTPFYLKTLFRGAYSSSSFSSFNEMVQKNEEMGNCIPFFSSLQPSLQPLSSFTSSQTSYCLSNNHKETTYCSFCEKKLEILIETFQMCITEDKHYWPFVPAFVRGSVDQSKKEKKKRMKNPGRRTRILRRMSKEADAQNYNK
ncbi:uncharacterized protein MONOS_10023 [Monocercomonoides exilis]|uniref:uncharacterized protein n=1 Tax=Monocercomonoides exilis TaxID=2049356 RepID=UPI00355A6C2D|nr:hypothetical protein MONOS_10023 [Monocercomonoides exilis]|eukprot:MONOS_10023.1-p1 / transcript=MONOS_10023.1 / gene=MONOS_10023 / organism=Monocercomonoides_exilis_PA203 / gene_product=unspecified product / transcript_product=unspecified product / location=Mono_scaffold00438:5218-7598(+) / protein_length=771 / sequence_SO=supercontig / SO=protein_coding / is_pseudo=false